MFKRVSALNLGDRRDVLLFTALGIVSIVVTLGWALLVLSGIFNIENIEVFGISLPNTYFLTLIVFGISALAAVLPRVLWARDERKPRATLMVRFGMALQIFGILITPIGLWWATNPIISVPVGFASFTAVLLGMFIAGFGGNMLAPAKA
jgi:hypothetical protein